LPFCCYPIPVYFYDSQAILCPCGIRMSALEICFPPFGIDSVTAGINSQTAGIVSEAAGINSQTTEI